MIDRKHHKYSQRFGELRLDCIGFGETRFGDFGLGELERGLGDIGLKELCTAFSLIASKVSQPQYSSKDCLPPSNLFVVASLNTVKPGYIPDPCGKIIY